ncbi:transglutaminase-like domain-containing protein [Chitinilyticum piscinae]|uniref:Transglutaminase family protein n=1 Tax=Chitinilyticum piscinae TaxID=2866724 RepID=A0A8J7G1W5_9NEIS|nr:transglutaminase family protein [Chitinilyticum piscinae]MBE9610460.1 transglutaminase family protein [Chitinilyticum piscinae]
MSLPAPADCLADSVIIDFRHPAVMALATSLRADDAQATAGHCFDWVRDRVEHCLDFRRDEVPVSASETLLAGTGFCYAKSHLLVALWRANSLPAALGYQRLTLDGPNPPYCVHGFAAVWLVDHGWYRCDPRGNSKPGIDCEFTPGHEKLAYPVDYPGECTYPGLWPEPPAELVSALRALPVASAFRKHPIDLVPQGLPMITEL